MMRSSLCHTIWLELSLVEGRRGYLIQQVAGYYLDCWPVT